MMMMFNFVWAKTLINENKKAAKQDNKKESRNVRREKELENKNVHQHHARFALDCVICELWNLWHLGLVMSSCH